MSGKFTHEKRYIVFKVSDVDAHFTPSERQQLARLADVQRVGRSESGKPLLECVVVEADWPEYEPTWKAIETRVTGARSVPEESAIQTAARVMNIELIRERDALRAKVEATEQQEQARLVTPTAYRWRYRGAIKWQYGELTEEAARLAKEHNHEVQPLYALPGAKGEEK